MGYVRGHFGAEESPRRRRKKGRMKIRRYNRDEYMTSGMLGESILSRIKGAIKKTLKTSGDTVKSEGISNVTQAVLSAPQVKDAMNTSAKRVAAEAAVQQMEASISKTEKFMKGPGPKIIGYSIAALGVYWVARNLMKQKSKLI